LITSIVEISTLHTEGKLGKFEEGEDEIQLAPSRSAQEKYSRMLLAEGKDRLREEVQRLRAMQASGASLGLSVDLSMMVAGGRDQCTTVGRQCPVQLDLLPMRPASQSSPAVPAPNPFAWQPLYTRSRSNSASGAHSEPSRVHAAF
jgi:hypothetical protein